MNRIFIFTVLFLAANSAFAEVEMWGRAYNYSCGYFSRTAADVSATLHEDVPANGTVEAIIGWAGIEVRADNRQEWREWFYQRVLPAKALSANSFEVRWDDATLHNRTDNLFLSSFQVVFVVKAPGLATRYYNGGSNMGWFQSEKLNVAVPCVQNGTLPPWKRLDVDVISR